MPLNPKVFVGLARPFGFRAGRINRCVASTENSKDITCTYCSDVACHFAGIESERENSLHGGSLTNAFPETMTGHD